MPPKRVRRWNHPIWPHQPIHPLRSPADFSAFRPSTTTYERSRDFTATLTERASGREVWRDRHRANTVDGSILSLSTGVFASVDDLRNVALRTMSQSVDTLLDKPAFRAALRR